MGAASFGRLVVLVLFVFVGTARLGQAEDRAKPITHVMLSVDPPQPVTVRQFVAGPASSAVRLDSVRVDREISSKTATAEESADGLSIRVDGVAVLKISAPDRVTQSWVVGFPPGEEGTRTVALNVRLERSTTRQARVLLPDGAGTNLRSSRVIAIGTKWGDRFDTDMAYFSPISAFGSKAYAVRAEMPLVWAVPPKGEFTMTGLASSRTYRVVATDADHAPSTPSRFSANANAPVSLLLRRFGKIRLIRGDEAGGSTVISVGDREPCVLRGSWEHLILSRIPPGRQRILLFGADGKVTSSAVVAVPEGQMVDHVVQE